MGTNSKTNKKTEYKKCTDCEKERRIGDYYNCKNPLFADGKVPICKKCLKEKININKVSTVQDFLKSVNLVFDSEAWNECVKKSEKNPLGQYMRRINSMRQYANLTWEDSTIEDKKNNSMSNVISNTMKEAIYEVEEDVPFKITVAMQRRWGKGLPPDEYEFLENSFNEWVNKCTCENFTQEKIYRNICWKELEIKRAREGGSPTDKLEKTLRDFMSDGQVTPKDINNNKEENTRTTGMIIKDIEMLEPAEYYKDKNLYKDVDGFGKYLSLFVNRSIKNLITDSNDFPTDEEIEEVLKGVSVRKDGK